MIWKKEFPYPWSEDEVVTRRDTLRFQNEGTLHCPCHDGLFDATTGNVLAGPPTRPLSLIQLAIQDGTIYAVKLVPR